MNVLDDVCTRSSPVIHPSASLLSVHTGHKINEEMHSRKETNWGGDELRELFATMYATADWVLTCWWPRAIER